MRKQGSPPRCRSQSVQSSLSMLVIREASATRHVRPRQWGGGIAADSLATRLGRRRHRVEERQQHRLHLLFNHFPARFPSSFLLFAQLVEMKIAPQLAEPAVTRIPEPGGS